MMAKYYDRNIKSKGREQGLVETIFAMKYAAAQKRAGIKTLFLTPDECEKLKDEVKLVKTSKSRYVTSGGKPGPHADLEAFFDCHVEVMDDVLTDLAEAKVA